MCHEFLYFYFFHDRTPIQPPGKRHGAWLCGVMNIVKSDSALWCTQKLLISLFHGVIHTAGFFEKFYYLDCEVRRTMHITEFLKNSNFSTKSKPKSKIIFACWLETQMCLNHGKMVEILVTLITFVFSPYIQKGVVNANFLWVYLLIAYSKKVW